ncbi:hypothetical protein AB4Z13_31450 [Rhizobium sp. YAF28]|uniref:hypothetical protein n=1 Tax=Rhizobium sp. YAF28 TaxID=3233081 RepID=UPI003F9BB6AA
MGLDDHAPHDAGVSKNLIDLPPVAIHRRQADKGLPFEITTIRDRIRQLGAFDVIRYAQKACSNIHILSLMREEGVLVDSVSLGEINRAQRAGFSTSPTLSGAGPLCESGDVFTQGADGVVETRALPPAEVGDLLVFHEAGAYGASMSSNYNSRLHAAEYLMDGENSRLIRRRQTIDELCELELIAAHSTDAA